MANDEVVLEAARSIRPYLSELAGPDAGDLDRQLSGLLGEAAAGRDGIDGRVLEILAHPTTDAWTASFMSKGMPPEVASFVERSFGLPGYPEPAAAPRFVCPVNNDYSWYRMNVGTAIPRCPTHKIVLVPAEAG